MSNKQVRKIFDPENTSIKFVKRFQKLVDIRKGIYLDNEISIIRPNTQN
jgi:hypothetical protein